MVIEVVIPMLGITVEKGKILRWIKREGEFVNKGEPIFEVETEKVVTEVESPGTGVLKRILVPENIEVPVLTLVGVITDKDEELPEKYKSIRPEAGKPEPETKKAGPGPLSKASGDGYDIAVLGAGPGGYVAAIRAAQMGARVLVVEKAELGGTCLNWGCIPTKSFLSDIEILRKVRTSGLFTNGASVSIDLARMVARKEKVVETMRRGISLLFDSQKITRVKGTARLVDDRTIEVNFEGETARYRSEHMIIATGSKVASLPGVNMDGTRILSSDDVVYLKEIPKEVLIIGGGVIGVEFACVFNGMGSKVTVLEMLPKIVATEDDEVIRGLKMLLEKQGIQILTETRVLKAEVKADHVEVTIEREGKQQVLRSQRVVQAVGRVPYTEGLGLDRLGFQMETRAIKVNSRMETSVDGIYAIGDVIGRMMLAHAASAEGIVAVENIMGKVHEMDYQKVPSCIYTFPEVASVGLKESEAKQRGYDVQVGKFPYLNNGKAMAIGETEGFVKIIAEKKLGQILGVHILGDRATDLIGECLLAMNVEASVEDLGKIVKTHPSLSEMIAEAALDWEERAIHIPKR
jgi:dihydrolipoamide dehydrogenase